MAASVCHAMKQRAESPTSNTPQRSDASAGYDQGMRVLSYLIAGVAVYGFFGWLGDYLLGTRFLLPMGIVLGAGFGVYVIIMRFGQITEQPPKPGRPRQRGKR